MEQQQFSVSGYLPNGMKVYFTIPMSDTANVYAEVLEFTNKLLADGLLLAAPGLEAGEEFETVDRISRRNQKNDDGSVSACIDAYSSNAGLKFKLFSLYLDSDEDVKAFEQACNVRVFSLPLNPTKAPVERDDETFVYKLPTPVRAVMKNNPHYNPDEPDLKKRKPKMLFVRWEGVSSVGNPTPAPSTPAQPEKPVSGQPDAEVLPLWTNTEVGKCWSVLKQWLVTEKIYENDFELKNSFIKRGISDGKTIADEWKHKPARELIAFVKARHAEVDINFMGEQKASGQ